MTEADEGDTSGTWRRYQFVLWTDVFVLLPATLVFMTGLVAAMLIALPMLQRAGVSQAAFYRMLPALLHRPLVAQALTGLSDLVLLFFLWRIARRVADGALVARYRAAGRLVPALALVGGVLLALLTIYGVTQALAHGLVKFHPAPHDRLFAPDDVWQYPVVIATAVLIAPFVEEFYFRGILLSWLGRKITLLPAALVSASIFALVHLRFVSHPGAEGWLFTGVIAVVGLINAGLAIRTGSLWPSFLLHAGYNATLLAAALLPRLL